MVGATPGTPEGFRPDQASGSQQPPPALPNLAEVMARQTELLNHLVQAQMNQYFSTQPPLFHKTEEPLDADAWLHTIESKFALLSTPCSEANKALLAAPQLRGTARIWWDHYYAMQPDGHVITWEEFRTIFSAHHIPEGLIERKLNEFLALTQGTRTVMQYEQAFNHLCQYAGYNLSHPIYKDINRAIIYAPGSSHAYIQQIIKISQHMSRIKAYKL
jgi:hypothetical protein